MKFTLIGHCEVDMEHSQGAKTSKHLLTRFHLDAPPPLDTKQYTKEGLPTQMGSKALTAVFVQGLIGNIHHAHEKGYWDSAEHLRYIIAELEKGFTAIAKVSKGVYPVRGAGDDYPVTEN